jgi:hypothetical protein
MHHEVDPPLENDPLEQLLGTFKPRPPAIDRDQLMFQAGMRAAQAVRAELPTLTRRARIWPALATVSTAAAVILAVLAWQRPERIVVVERLVERETQAVNELESPSRKVEVPQIASELTPSIDPAANYVRQRDLVLREGPDALASKVVSGGGYEARSLPTQRELLNELPGFSSRRKHQVDAEAWWQPWLITGDRL